MSYSVNLDGTEILTIAKMSMNVLIIFTRYVTYGILHSVCYFFLNGLKYDFIGIFQGVQLISDIIT